MPVLLMPETTLHPSGQPKADTIVADKVLDQYTALRLLGWIQPIDYFMLFLIALSWATIVAWVVFGKPTPWNILCCVLMSAILSQVWTIILVFRCSHFVLLIQAYLHTLPEEAARLVMANYSGQTIQKPRK